MRKARLFFMLHALLLGVWVHAQFKVQGVPYPLKEGQEPPAMLRHAEGESFTFDDVEFWVGEGANRALLVIQWNMESETNAMAWGYRWDGEANGEAMMKAVVEADPRFFFMTETGTQFGSTVAGLGYDANGDGEFALCRTDNPDEVVRPDENGIIYTSGYSYDGWESVDPADYWQGGWFQGYWSYWVRDDVASEWGYSGTGISGRKLTDGCWDGWNFAVGMSPQDWKPVAPAPKPAEEPLLPAEFTEGFFIQNEDWFGHAAGSLNWVDNTGKLYYDVDNKANGNQEVLGNTSQYGMVYGDYYYAMSKQGARLVILEARTLKLVKSFENIGGGDGRAVLGVDTDKVYVSSSAGIFVLDVPTLTLADAAIEGTAGTSQYDGQNGVMVRVGSYVFAARQSVGVLVIDPETDMLVRTIECADVQGLTVSRDGSVWAGAQKYLLRINPVSLDTREVSLPHAMTNVWGAWVPDKLCADPDEDALYYAYGGSWAGGETSLGKLLVGADGSLTEAPDFHFVMPAAADASKKQMIYGKPGIDPQSGYLLLTTTQSGYGTNYSYNWLHYVDRRTGEVVKTVSLTHDDGQNYYWFPAMMVFPDNHAPQLNFDEVYFTDAQPQTFSFADMLTDADNLPVLAVWTVVSNHPDVLSVKDDGLHLTLVPVADGVAELTLRANSNGRIAEKQVSVSVSGNTTGLNRVQEEVSVYPNPFADYLVVQAKAECEAVLYDLSGRPALSVRLQNGENRIDASALPQGTYLLKWGDDVLKVVK